MMRRESMREGAVVRSRGRSPGPRASRGRLPADQGESLSDGRALPPDRDGIAELDLGRIVGNVLKRGRRGESFTDLRGLVSSRSKSSGDRHVPGDLQLMLEAWDPLVLEDPEPLLQRPTGLLRQ